MVKPSSYPEFDYSTPEGAEAIRRVLVGVLELRRGLKKPGTARKVGSCSRLYERTLGVAVPFVLLRRAARERRKGRPTEEIGIAGLLVRDVRREVICESTVRKVVLYERSLGLAVAPVLARRIAYAVRRRLRRTPVIR
ncbi:MAG: hypothetical protein U1E26_05825 [Coriobacteriia bacterium]|nr:hypothetical protein [Coriobacteriia bacterium]